MSTIEKEGWGFVLSFWLLLSLQRSEAELQNTERLLSVQQQWLFRLFWQQVLHVCTYSSCSVPEEGEPFGIGQLLNPLRKGNMIKKPFTNCTFSSLCQKVIHGILILATAEKDRKLKEECNDSDHLHDGRSICIKFHIRYVMSIYNTYWDPPPSPPPRS